MAAVCLVCFILKLSKLILTDKIGIPLELTAIVTSFIIQKGTINTITISFMFTFFHENWRCSICFFQTNCLPNSNFCQFSIQTFRPIFSKKTPIFCQLFAQFFANCLPIFCQFFACINFQKLLLYGIFFRP